MNMSKDKNSVIVHTHPYEHRKYKTHMKHTFVWPFQFQEKSDMEIDIVITKYDTI